jgi:hypothetical protein
MSGLQTDQMRLSEAGAVGSRSMSGLQTDQMRLNEAAQPAREA